MICKLADPRYIGSQIHYTDFYLPVLHLLFHQRRFTPLTASNMTAAMRVTSGHPKHLPLEM